MLWASSILALIWAKLSYLIEKILLPFEGKASWCDSLGKVSCRWSPVILEKLHLHFYRITLLPHENGTLVAAGKSQVVKRLDANTLADVFSQKSGPVVSWYNNGSIWIAYHLSYIDCCRTVHNFNKVK